MYKQIYKLADEVINGDADALKAYIELKKVMFACEESLKAINDSALSEAEKYGQKAFTVFGAEVQIAETGTRYDYSLCNDTEWSEANSNCKLFSEKKKEREIFLKALKKETTIVSEVTGEIISIFPPGKTSTTGLKIKMNNENKI